MSVFYLSHGKLIPLTLSSLVKLVECLTKAKCPLFELDCFEDELFSDYYEDPDSNLRVQAYLLENQRNQNPTYDGVFKEDNLSNASLPSASFYTQL